MTLLLYGCHLVGSYLAETLKIGGLMPRQLSEEKLAEAREIFKHFDTNRNDKMEPSEFYGLLQALGGGFSRDEAEVGFQELDTDGNGIIDFAEFVTWWKEH